MTKYIISNNINEFLTKEQIDDIINNSIKEGDNKKKKNNKNDDMKVISQGFEEGYEDPKEAQLKEAKRRIEEAKKPFNPMDFLSTKNIIIFIF